MNQQGLIELKQLVREIRNGDRPYNPHPTMGETNPISEWKVFMDMEKLGIKPKLWIIPYTSEGITVDICRGILNLNKLPGSSHSCIEYAANCWGLTRDERWLLLAGKWWVYDVEQNLKKIEELGDELHFNDYGSIEKAAGCNIDQD